MDIVCCADNRYAPYCGVMLASLLENNREEEVTVYLIGNGLTDESCARLRRVVEQDHTARLVFVEMDHSLVQHFPNSKESYISLVAYYRLFLTSVLPESLGKVLYLDCDLIVNGSLRKLWQTDLTGRPLAAVPDAHKGMDEHCRALGLDCRKYPYFNSGVVLFNLDYLRGVDFTRRALEYVQAHRAEITFHDQDVLNGLFAGQVVYLPYRYNLHDRLYRRHRYVSPSVMPTGLDELAHPVIVQFSSARTPWTPRCLHPCRSLYFRYLALTPWRDMRPVLSWRDRLWRCNRILSGHLCLANGYRRLKRPLL